MVLHKLCFGEAALGQYSTRLAEELGPTVYDDSWIRAYEVPGDPAVSMALREGA